MVKRLDGNKIYFRFKDVDGILFFSNKFFMRSDFVKPLKKLKNFKNFHIEDGHTLLWSNGFGLGIINIHSALKKKQIMKFF